MTPTAQTIREQRQRAAGIPISVTPAYSAAVTFDYCAPSITVIIEFAAIARTDR